MTMAGRLNGRSTFRLASSGGETRSFVPKRHDGIDPRRTHGRKPAGEKRNRREKDRAEGPPFARVNERRGYSLLNAIAGSIRAARRAGSEPAPIATITRTPMAAAIVIGSVAVTS